MGTNRFYLDFGEARGCRFTLTPDGFSKARYRSIKFDILRTNYERGARVWSEQNTPIASTIEASTTSPSSTLSSSEPPSSEPPSITSNPVRAEPSVSASSYSSNPSAFQSSASIASEASRPNVVLADDLPESQFNQSCLEINIPRMSSCWNVLRLEQWIKQWHGNMSSTSCIRDKSLEPYCLRRGDPWTSNFLRASLQSGAQLGCFNINSAQCRYTEIVTLPGESRVLTARYRYVSWTIISKFDYDIYGAM